MYIVIVNGIIITITQYVLPMRTSSAWRSVRRARTVRRAATKTYTQSHISKGILTTGHRLVCKDFMCFDTMPCRHMRLLVHF